MAITGPEGKEFTPDLMFTKYGMVNPYQGEGYPDPSAFCSNVEHVLAKEICFITI